MTEWNPIWAAFAKVMHQAPEDARAVDFMCWVSAERAKFERAHPKSKHDAAAWLAWCERAADTAGQEAGTP